MIFYFKDELDHIDFETEPTSFMHPMGKVNHEEIKLEGFSWDLSKRPKEKTDVSPIIANEVVNKKVEKDELDE